MKHAHRAAVLSLAVVAGVGCAKTHQDEERRGSNDSHQTTPMPNDELAKGIRYFETPRRRERRKLPKGGQLVPIDYRSLLQDDEADKDKNDFVPAASASYTVRYRLREGELAWRPLENALRFLDLGVGLNVAVLPFSDETELGAGGQITLFDNLLQFGVGYSLTNEDDNRYWYVGIGVLEALNEIGKLNIGKGGD